MIRTDPSNNDRKVHRPKKGHGSGCLCALFTGMVLIMIMVIIMVFTDPRKNDRKVHCQKKGHVCGCLCALCIGMVLIVIMVIIMVFTDPSKNDRKVRRHGFNNDNGNDNGFH